MIDSVFLFDDAPWRRQLLPLVATRPVSDLRVGINTIAQKWAWYTKNKTIFFLTVDYLRGKYGNSIDELASAIVIKGNVIPNDRLVEEIRNLSVGTVLMTQGEWIACNIDKLHDFTPLLLSTLRAVEYNDLVRFINYPEDVYRVNALEITEDLRRNFSDTNSGSLPKHNTYYGDQIKIDGVHSFRGATLNAEEGPIYIGEGAILEDGISIKGPAAICAGARVKTGSRIYPNVTIGPGSTVCGEINNTVIWGNSAKGHEGYLGCAVIGEGCNLGAGTSNSNLRNDWKNVRLYDYASHAYRDTGMQKCGMVMGDFAMVAIHTRFTTGTVVGVGVQVALSGFVPKFVPDFLWLTDTNATDYQLEKFLTMLERAGAKKINTMNPLDSRIFEYQYTDTDYLRKEYLYKLSK